MCIFSRRYFFQWLLGSFSCPFFFCSARDYHFQSPPSTSTATTTNYSATAATTTAAATRVNAIGHARVEDVQFGGFAIDRRRRKSPISLKRFHRKLDQKYQRKISQFFSMKKVTLCDPYFTIWHWKNRKQSQYLDLSCCWPLAGEVNVTDLAKFRTF